MAKVFILAGEASGDRIGAALMSGVQAHMPVTVTGVGGDAMMEQGLDPLFPMDDLAVMGYADVIMRLPLLLWRARQVIRTILRQQPDVVVLIDAQVFSQVVASGLRKRGYTGKIILYVAPSVWAWKPERAAKIASLYTAVLSVLPFEPRVMQELGGPQTSYVGHPALTKFPMRQVPPSSGPLLLLPGSRTGEIRRHLPYMRQVAERLSGHPALAGFVIPTPRGQYDRVARAVDNWSMNVTVVAEEAERLQAMEAAVLAFAVSGTATLELALAGVPHVVTYIAEGAQVRMFQKALIRTIALPNIIAGTQIVPEVLFAHKGEVGTAVSTISALLDAPDKRAEQVRAFGAIRQLMEKGAPEAPLEDPAERIMSYLR